LTLAGLALAEIQANVPASMRRQAAGEGESSVPGSRRSGAGKRQRLALLGPEEAQFVARQLQSPAVQAIKDRCSEDLLNRFQKIQHDDQLDPTTRRSVERLYRLVGQMQRYAEDPQSDYFVHSGKVLGFMADVKTTVKRLEDQLGMREP
jgi:hypothetical protein